MCIAGCRRAAANTALVLGFTAIVLGYFVPPFRDWAKAIHDFHFLGLVFGSLVLLMLVWAKAAPLEEAWEQRYSGDVDLTPWKPAKIFGFLLVLVVLDALPPLRRFLRDPLSLIRLSVWRPEHRG